MAESYSGGEIISRETANQSFGMASFSVSLLSEEMLDLASKTEDLLMFNFKGDQLFILGDARKPLYPEGVSISLDDIFKVYSKAKVLELIQSGGTVNNYIELRTDRITITNVEYTLEFGSMCPPWCSV
jgi:hypothetical protein